MADTTRTLRLKKLGYLVFLVTPSLPIVGWYLGSLSGAPNLSSWFTVLFIYGLIPVMDYVIGTDASNPSDEQIDALRSDRWYKLLVLACVPVIVAVMAWGAYTFVKGGLAWWGQIGLVISVGMVSSTLSINVAHELIHKRTRAERAAGGFLLSLVCYAGFKVEHVRGHHVNVSTPLDASSARFNQSLYNFVPRAWLHNFMNAWRLEAERLRYRGYRALHWRNELIWWYTLSAAIAVAFTLTLGIAGLIYFLAQSFVAFTLLEVVNYLEHYGLQRRQLDSGRYERTTHLHSWNSNYLLTNLLLFQLQRHSDHHENPTREYQLLRHYDASPQLPAGYATMMLLAMVPPLWRRVMNPRVERFYAKAPA